MTHPCPHTLRRNRAGRWRARTALALAIAVPLSGCYTYVPVQPGTADGRVVQLELNDRGRAALGDSIGPSATTIEGRVRSASDSVLQLEVRSVQYISGQTNRWSGEPLNVRLEQVNRTRERRFSKLRTYGLGAGLAAVALGLALQTDLFGRSSGGPGGPPGGGNPPPQQ